MNEMNEKGRAGGGWSLRNEGPGADWPCLDGPDSDVLRSAIVVSENYEYDETESMKRFQLCPGLHLEAEKNAGSPIRW